MLCIQIKNEKTEIIRKEVEWKKKSGLIMQKQTYQH